MNYNKILKDLKKDGISVFSNFIENEKIKVLISNFDQFLKNEKNVWTDSQNSDNRIYGIDILDPFFKEIFESEDLKKIYNNYISSKYKYSFVMANKLEFKKNNLGSGGGWHRDTFFSKQLKFILYLVYILL